MNNKLTNAVVLRWVNGPDPTNPIDAIPYCLCKHHCDLPMPSNWQKLAFELIRPKMKKVKRKNDKAKSPRPRKRVRYVGESDEDDNRPKMVYIYFLLYIYYIYREIHHFQDTDSPTMLLNRNIIFMLIKSIGLIH